MNTTSTPAPATGPVHKRPLVALIAGALGLAVVVFAIGVAPAFRDDRGAEPQAGTIAQVDGAVAQHHALTEAMLAQDPENWVDTTPPARTGSVQPIAYIVDSLERVSETTAAMNESASFRAALGEPAVTHQLVLVDSDAQFASAQEAFASLNEILVAAGQAPYLIQDLR